MYKRQKLAWNVISRLIEEYDKPCIVILDELQELSSGVIVNDKGDKLECHTRLLSLLTMGGVTVIGTGSSVGMMTNKILEYPVSNRIRRWKLYELEDEDIKELVRVMVEKEGYEVYEGLWRDIKGYVGGNPYYIITLMEDSERYTKIKRKKKSFRNREELEEVYKFEVLSKEGEIYKHWDRHLKKYEDKLNDEGERRGLTFRLMKCISDMRGDVVYMSKIVKEMKEREGEIEEKEIRERLKRLNEADLIESYSTTDDSVVKLMDKVLRDAISIIRSKEIYGIDDKREAEEVVLKEKEERIKMELEEEKRKREELEARVKHIEKSMRKVIGKINYIMGNEYEEKIKELLQEGSIDIGYKYQVIGDIRNEVIKSGQKKYDCLLYTSLSPRD